MTGSVTPLHERARCKATSKRSGERCNNAPMIGQAVCRMHGGATQASRAKAKERILEAADPAAANLVAWMNNDDVDMSLRVKIAQDLLNRAGLSGKVEIEVSASSPFEEMIAGVVASVNEEAQIANYVDYSERGDVVDAEVVEDQPPHRVPDRDAYRLPGPSSTKPYEMPDA